MRRIARAAKLQFQETAVFDMFVALQQRRELNDWLRAGRSGLTPHLAKRMTVQEYADRYRLQTFVETGTYLGYMVRGVRNQFRRIYSIELDPALYVRAARKFARQKNAVIMQGDSANVLPQILTNLAEPCLFWLDAHYSGGNTARGEVDTPIVQELSAILTHPITEHVILIDDAREFGVQRDYPSLLQIRELVSRLRSGASVEVRHDILRVH